MSLVLHGMGISPDVVIGRARVLKERCPDIIKRTISADKIEYEIARFLRAIERAKAQLAQAREHISPHSDTDLRGFVDAHLLMLSGTTLIETPINTIRTQYYSAEWSLKLQRDYLVSCFDGMDDPYLKSRKNDVEQVIERVHCILMRPEESTDAILHSVDQYIVIAKDLTPADTLLMHSNGIQAFVTETGGALSHTAILAKSLGIPAIIGVHNASLLLQDNAEIILDGKSGTVLTMASPSVVAYYQTQQKNDKQHQDQLKKLVKCPNQTQNGRPIRILANIESADEAQHVLDVGAEGVGLLRTELLFMNRKTIPTEEEHFQVYCQIIHVLGQRPITIRTLDLGADKTLSQAPPQNASNPALGLRAIRLCLSDTSLFIPQIRAILRASALGNIRLMIPMLTALQELDSVQKIIQTEMQNLAAESVPFNPNLLIGGMIETPAAALCIDQFAQRLDFLAIGTNDLIQYTLAIDRIDGSVNYLFNPSHPAILKLIHTIIKAAHTYQVPVCLCGEMASDIRYTRLLLGLGLTEFSMNPNAILEIKNQITHSDDETIEPLVKKLLTLGYPREVERVLETLNR